MNEIEMLLQKAAMGCGFDVGRAQDIAHAGCFLLANGFAGADIVLKALQTGIKPVIYDDKKAAITGGDAASTALAALDLLLGKITDKIIIKTSDSPLFVLGVAGSATAQHEASIIVEKETTRLSTRRTFLACDESETENNADCKSRSWRIRNGVITPYGHDQVLDLDGRAIVRKQSWQELLALAQKTYVPASQVSREQGAGAGLLDND